MALIKFGPSSLSARDRVSTVTIQALSHWMWRRSHLEVILVLLTLYNLPLLLLLISLIPSEVSPIPIDLPKSIVSQSLVTVVLILPMSSRHIVIIVLIFTIVLA
jgi:hypothetical protein